MNVCVNEYVCVLHVSACESSVYVRARVRVTAEKQIWHETAKPGAHPRYTSELFYTGESCVSVFSNKKIHIGALFHHKR